MSYDHVWFWKKWRGSMAHVRALEKALREERGRYKRAVEIIKAEGERGEAMPKERITCLVGEERALVCWRILDDMGVKDEKES